MVEFIRNDTFLFADFHNKSKLFRINEQYLIGNETKLNRSKEEYAKRKEEYMKAFEMQDYEKLEELETQRQIRERQVMETCKMGIEDCLKNATETINEKKARLEAFRPKLAEGEEKVNKATKLLWTVTNCLFVVGGMIGMT